MAEIFPNAPLKSAAFEIRFPGELSIEAKRHEFQDKIRDKYPKLYVPNVQEGTSPALQPYTFRNEEETKNLRIAVNSFSIVTSQYEGFASFKAEFLSFLELFQGLFNIQKLTRTGLRYTNHIPIFRDDSIIPFREYLNVRFQTPDEISEDCEELTFASTRRLGDGKLRCLIQHQIELPEGKEILLLDFDYFLTGDLSPARISDYLDVSHTHTKQTFTTLLTENYTSIMRGETQ